ncbi:MAG: zf-HC2 domain-containing protein [Candidatus Coatesbacteria bacterium]|nr:MAG: zf-HC2 domain-containing protein [Candidatus Coatesbacteria bacterium]
MDCIDKKKISAYLDGETPKSERARIEKHLAECPACRTEANELAAVSDALDVLEGLEPDAYFAARVKRLATERKQHGWFGRALVPAAATVAAAAFLLLGGFIGQALHAAYLVERSEAGGEFAEYAETSAIEDYPEGTLGEVLDDFPLNGGNI